MTDGKIVIFIIDDDVSIRRSLSLLLQSAGYEAELFESAELFLERERNDRIGCIVLDVRMTGMSGMNLQEELIKVDCHLPIILLTGLGNIPLE